MTDIVTWAEENWHPPSERGKPIVLAEHQRRILRHVFTRDSAGRFPYQTVLWSEVKKSGKTELAALVSYWLAKEEGPYSEVYMLANDFEQSKARGFQAMTRAVQRFKRVKVQADRVLLPNGSSIQALASEYAGAAGANPVCSTWDELWAYVSESSRRLWEEFTPVPTRRNSLRFIVTYAGFQGESALLEELYKLGLQAEPVPGLEDIDNGDGEPACRAAGGLFFFWSHQPRMPWQTPDYYERQRSAPGFRPNAYLRLHENRWVTPESRFIEAAQWDALVEPGLTPLLPTKGVRLCVGVDAAHRRDSTAVVAVSREEGGLIVLRQHRIWRPTEGHPVLPEETAVPYLRQLAREYDVAAVYYDPHHFESAGVKLGREGLPAVAFEQTPDNLTRAGSALFDAITAGTLRVYNAPDLRVHVLNAVAVESARGWRLAKEKASRKVDAAVALAMAVEASRHYSGSPPDWEPSEESEEANKPILAGIWDMEF